MRKIIDLSSESGFTLGFIGAPPYTLAQYEQAKSNMDNLQLLINEAYEDGFNEVEFVNFELSLPYIKTIDTALATSQPCIVLNENTKYYFNKSKIDIIFDSNNKSPYHTTTVHFTQPYQLNGVIFEFSGVGNSEINDVELIGDIYKRSFTNTNEKSNEQTYGVKVNRSNCHVKNCVIKGFMGDGITGNYNNTDSVGTAYVFNNGLVNTDGTINTTQAGCFVTDLRDLNTSVISDLKRNDLQSFTLRRFGGYRRVPDFKFYRFELIFYNSSGLIIERFFSSFLQDFNISYKATHFRVQLYNETTEDSVINYGLYGFEIINSSKFNIIEGNTIAYNHRGGISNLGAKCLIKNNLFLCNGLDSDIGAPLFPDSTRYQINIEDYYAQNVIIENNSLVNSFNGILIGANYITVRDNDLNQSGGIVIYRNIKSLIDNNTIKLSNSVIPAFGIRYLTNPDAANYERNISFINNYVDFSGVSGRCILLNNDLYQTHITIENNIFNTQLIEVRLPLSAQNEDRLKFNNNKIYFKNETPLKVRFDHINTFANIRSFSGNTIEYIGVPNGSGRLLLKNINGKCNKVINCVIEFPEDFKLNSTTNRYNYIEGFEFIKCSGTQGNTTEDGNVINVELHFDDCTFIDSFVTIKSYKKGTYNRILTLSNSEVFLTDNTIKNTEAIFRFSQQYESTTVIKNFNLSNVYINKSDIVTNDIYLVNTGAYTFFKYNVNVKLNEVRSNYDLKNFISLKGEV